VFRRRKVSADRFSGCTPLSLAVDWPAGVGGFLVLPDADRTGLAACVVCGDEAATDVEGPAFIGGPTDGDAAGFWAAIDVPASGSGTAAREAEGASEGGSACVTAAGGSVGALRLLRAAHPTHNAAIPTLAEKVRAETNMGILR